MALKALHGLVIYCHSSVLMTGIKVPLWDLVPLPFIMNGDDLMSSVDLHVD